MHLLFFLPIPHFSSFLFFFFLLIQHSTSHDTLFIFCNTTNNANTYSTSPHSAPRKNKGMPRLNARDRTEMHRMQQAQYTDGTATDLRLLHSLDDLGGLRRKGTKDSEEEEGDPGPISWHQRISIWMINEGMFICFVVFMFVCFSGFLFLVVPFLLVVSECVVLCRVVFRNRQLWNSIADHKSIRVQTYLMAGVLGPCLTSPAFF